jgi:hypothetical protein
MKVRNIAPVLAAALALSLTLGGTSVVFAADTSTAMTSAMKAAAKPEAPAPNTKTLFDE